MSITSATGAWVSIAAFCGKPLARFFTGAARERVGCVAANFFFTAICGDRDFTLPDCARRNQRALIFVSRLACGNAVSSAGLEIVPLRSRSLHCVAGKHGASLMRTARAVAFLRGDMA